MENIFNLEHVSMWGENVLNFLFNADALINKNDINTNNIEAHAEGIRKRSFPSMPSRYSVMYGCETLEECYRWIEELNIDRSVRIFEIEYEGSKVKKDARFLNQCALFKVEDMNIRDFYELQKGLTQYWKGCF